MASNPYPVLVHIYEPADTMHVACCSHCGRDLIPYNVVITSKASVGVRGGWITESRPLCSLRCFRGAHGKDLI